jgi:hypothetical protein
VLSTARAPAAGCDRREKDEMAENANIEIAQHLREHGGHEAERSRRREEILEIVEAVLLAAVAIMTAWSGYQAALWDGESAKHYAESSRMRSESVELSLESNQVLAYNAGTFNAWLQARASGQRALASVLVGRFTAEYRTAFDAWLKTDPFTNPDAPAGPGLMPEYRDPTAEKATELGKEATHAYDLGVEARHRGEQFVRLTVVLAAVLFLIAVGQRFRIRNVRLGVLGVAGVFLIFGLVMLASLPRA